MPVVDVNYIFFTITLLWCESHLSLGTNMNKTEVANAIDSMISGQQQQQGTKTVEQLLSENEPIYWESLFTLVEELNPAVGSFLDQIMAITTNKDIIDNLGDSKVEFDKYINLFISDMDKFSKLIAAVKEEHKDESGIVATDADYAKYTSIAFKYEGAYMNITQIVTPILIQLMGIISDTQRRLPKPDKLAAIDATNINVITDVVPKTIN